MSDGIARTILLSATATLGLAAGCLCWMAEPAAAQGGAARKTAAREGPAKAADATPSRSKGLQSIVLLVNDEPITGYEIDQRARYLAANQNISDQAKDAFNRLIHAESTSKHLRAILDEVIAANRGKTREQILAIFEERKKQYGLTLQKQAVESARSSVLPGLRKKAQEDLIEEHLKLQEAKKLGVEVSDADVNKIIKSIADRNKLSLEQFEQHLKGAGFGLQTLKDRLRAQEAWNEVIRRRFAAQISIGQRDIDRLVSAEAVDAGADAVELQLQKITLAIPASKDQSGMARRYREAEALSRKFTGCKSMAGLTKMAGDAHFDDLKYVKPSSVPEPTRSMLLAARDGDMLPPATTPAGIELYAVCGRRSIKADDKQREKALQELQIKEFRIFSERHLRDVRQDAHIEYR
jgi:peptidyl-prolyl cis-trans isomerase SurA